MERIIADQMSDHFCKQNIKAKYNHHISTWIFKGFIYLREFFGVFK